MTKINEDFVKYIEENTTISEIDGELHCNRCGSPVVVDWFEQRLECTGCDEL